jgi:hypothetical protein
MLSAAHLTAVEAIKPRRLGCNTGAKWGVGHANHEESRSSENSLRLGEVSTSSRGTGWPGTETLGPETVA